MFSGMTDANPHGTGISPEERGRGKRSGIWLVSVLSGQVCMALGIRSGQGREKCTRNTEAMPGSSSW